MRTERRVDRPRLLPALCAITMVACGSETGGAPQANPPPTRAEFAASGGAAGGGGRLGEHDATLASDVQAVTRTDDALPGTFIPPFLDCREPLSGEVGSGRDGRVCTNVSIAGCTEEGKRFSDYASCDVVRTQRPFWPAPAASEPRADDPRLADAAFVTELDWVTTQVNASGCSCCHDSKVVGGMAAQWDISKGPIWTDTVSDSGVALFVGLADSSVLGAYPREDNNGFDRTLTGLPTTDTARMQAFFKAELMRRGISEAQAEATPPFGGPIYANSVAKPGACDAGVGVADGDLVEWKGGDARYVYVLNEGSKNPGVPPNFDTPDGTLWRLDVLASRSPVGAGFGYGTTPEGTFQAVPKSSHAPTLERGTRYQLYVLRDVGLPVTNCVFTYGSVGIQTEAKDAPTSGSAPAIASASNAAPSKCTLQGGDEQGFGAACAADGDCTCAANYCAMMPGQTMGYCSKKGCKQDPRICPANYSCFDVSAFQAGAPSICIK
jgi:hypothetical protein